MILQTTLKDLDEFVYKYDELLGWADGCEVEDCEDIHLGISNCRIQIPSLNISLRAGELMSRRETNDAGWEVGASCTIVCELDERDMHKYLGWTTEDFRGAVYDFFYPKYKNLSELDDIPCIINTSDFISDEEKANRYVKECEEAYEED